MPFFTRDNTGILDYNGPFEKPSAMGSAGKQPTEGRYRGRKRGDGPRVHRLPLQTSRGMAGPAALGR